MQVAGLSQTATDALTIGGVATALPLIRILLRDYVHKPLATTIVKWGKQAEAATAKKTDSNSPDDVGSVDEKENDVGAVNRGTCADQQLPQDGHTKVLAPINGPASNGKNGHAVDGVTAAGQSANGKAAAAKNGKGSANKNSDVEKCYESLWKLTLYTAFTIGELWVGSQFSWFWDPSQLFDNWPGQEHPAILRMLYLVTFGYCISCIYMHQFWETRRSDHNVMLTHHVITLGLVAGSYYLNVLPVGCMVLVCHDCNDILMELAKICKYAGSDLAASVTFVAFTALWCFTRLYIYPAVVIRACFVYLNPRFPTLPPSYVAGLYALEALLCSLVVIHIYWTYLIFKILHEALTKEIKDCRE